MTRQNPFLPATVGAVALCVLALCATPNPLQAVTLDISPTDLGWWNTTDGHSAGNQNYFVGSDPVRTYHNYFTFDLPSLVSGALATDATLEVQLFLSNGPPVVTYTLFDVSTPPGELDASSPPNPVIFSDLGSGASYGQFEVGVGQPATTVLRLPLNAGAVMDINAALGRSFSVGGALLSNTPAFPASLFGGSGDPPPGVRLVLSTTGPVEIPEPPPLGFVALVIGGLAIWRGRVRIGR